MAQNDEQKSQAAADAAAADQRDKAAAVDAEVAKQKQADAAAQAKEQQRQADAAIAMNQAMAGGADDVAVDPDTGAISRRVE